MTTRRRQAFTLVELLAVTVVLALAMGMVTLSLNGVTRKGRLTTAMRQAASFDQAARVQALAEGTPRLMEFTRGTSRLRVRVQESVAGRWRWSEGSTFRMVHGPHVEGVIFPDQYESTATTSGPWRVRIGSDGTSMSYAVQFGPAIESNSPPSLVLEGITGQSRVVWEALRIESVIEEMSQGSCAAPATL